MNIFRKNDFLLEIYIKGLKQNLSDYSGGCYLLFVILITLCSVILKTFLHKWKFS